MQTLTVSLPEQQLQRLREMAESLNLSLEELVRASLEMLLVTGTDEAFEKALEYVLQKNEELYRRLS